MPTAAGLGGIEKTRRHPGPERGPRPQGGAATIGESRLDEDE